MEYKSLRGPSYQSRGVQQVTPDLACLQILIVNVYFVGEPSARDRSWVLIDAGLWGSAKRIARTAEERFGKGAKPAAILLTHGHFDHVGAVRELATLWEVPVYAHELEMPYLTGRSDYPPPDPTVGGGAMAQMSRFFPRSGIDLGERARSLPADGTVPAMPGWRWIHTPGHTAGHISLFREADRLLVAGDAFVTVKQESALAVLTQWQEVCRPPAYFTSDWQAARRSVETLAALQPLVAATGHGLPMRGERMEQELQALARDFDRVAVPACGRYVRQPAVADARGVVAVPPPVPDPMRKVLAGVGLVALAGVVAAALWRRNNRSR
jgi:glyoxylase-like metal-dependent hydrolase (beta-lactamase superfamily II)